MPTTNNKTLTPPLFVNSDIANHHTDRASTEFTRREGWGVRSNYFVRAVLPPLPVVVLLIASLTTFATAAIAQDDAQPEPETQTLTIQVVDEEGAAIEGVSLHPTLVKSQQPFRGIRQPRVVTNGEGEATFVFPVGRKGPISRVHLWAHHNSFLEDARSFDIADELVTITLKRGIQVAASALAPVTNEPIKQQLYAMTNQDSSVDWNSKSNGTLISPVMGKNETSLRLVQLAGGKAIRFSKLVDIRRREKSRLRFSNLEMVDAVTVTGSLGDEVPRPVKFGVVMSCVTSISQTDASPDSSQPSWSWKSSAEVNPDGTFTLEGIPANSALQVFCACPSWANKRLTQEQANAEFPKEARLNSSPPLPQLFQIGEQDTEITVSMQPLGSVTVNVVDQDNRPIKEAPIVVSLSKRYFYLKRRVSYDPTSSSLSRLVQRREKLPNFTLPYFAKKPTDFQNEFSFHNLLTNTNGSVVINGVPPGAVSVSHPDGEGEQVIVKSGENVDVKRTLIRIDPEDGGEDD